MFKRYGWVFAVMALIGPIIGLVTSAMLTYVMPKMYESETVIEVKPLPSAIPSGQQMTPQFFETEFNKITSRNSLIQVIDALQLTSRWSVDKEAAIQILKKIVHTENIRGTELISIRVRHTDKVATRDIANEVAHVYKNYRNEVVLRDADARLQALTKAVRDQEDKVEERRKILASIVRKKGIINQGDVSPGDSKTLQPENPTPDSGKPNPAESERDAAIRRSLDDQDYIDAKRDFVTDQELLQQMKLKLIAESLELKISPTLIEIHGDAKISEAPVSPNVTLNLLLGTVGGFLLSPLLSLLVIGGIRLFAKPVTAQ